MAQAASRSASPLNSVVKIGIGLLLALAIALLVFTLFIKVAKPVPTPAGTHKTSALATIQVGISV